MQEKCKGVLIVNLSLCVACSAQPYSRQQAPGKGALGAPQPRIYKEVAGEGLTGAYEEAGQNYWP